MIPNDKPFLIGETAFHHQGDVNFLKALVGEGIKAGIDAIKFHLLFDISDYFVQNHTAYSALAELCIPVQEWNELHNDLIEKKIKPIYLCNDVAALKWVNSLPEKTVLAVELHSTGVNDIFLLQEAANFKGTIMLGVGGCQIEEIVFAVNFLKDRSMKDVLLMHGFQNYPTNYEEINFSKMEFLRSLFNLPVGYADHTDPKDPLCSYISCLPMSQGYNVLEKHFSHVSNEERIDSQAAVNVGQLREIKSLMATFYSTRGLNPLIMSNAELKYGDTGPMKKAIVARRKINKGQLIQMGDVAFKRTNVSVPVKQRDLQMIIGSEAKCDLDVDTPLTFENIAYTFKASNVDQFFVHKKVK